MIVLYNSMNNKNKQKNYQQYPNYQYQQYSPQYASNQYNKNDNMMSHMNGSMMGQMNGSMMGHMNGSMMSHMNSHMSNNMNKYKLNLKDYGPEPFVINIEAATVQNDNFRTALWTGKHLQLTLMSIPPGGDIGLEIHPHLDQFIRVEEGQGMVKMGDSKNNLSFQAPVYADYSFIIPAGKWHNLVNTGNKPIKLYSIYAPTQHPKGTVHKTKEDALESENHNRFIGYYR